MIDKIPLLIIAGPTGVGKTELSIKIAKDLGGEIISCDSMQIYKYMDIGSAKIREEEKEGIAHHLIDIIDPRDEFSVADYKELAEEKIKDVHNRNKYPIMVGGTGLYINSIVYNFNFTENMKDEELRREYESIAREKGNNYLHNLLREVDEKAANKIHENNVKRVIRALEVTKLTGKAFSDQVTREEVNPLYKVNYFYLNMDREKLYKRIDQRVEEMINEGLLEEVVKLKKMGLNNKNQSMQGIGYKELLEYLYGNTSKEEAIEKIKQGSRNYAKRQQTWFRNDKLAKELNKDLMSLVYMIEYIKKKIL